MSQKCGITEKNITRHFRCSQSLHQGRSMHAIRSRTHHTSLPINWEGARRGGGGDRKSVPGLNIEVTLPGDDFITPLHDIPTYLA